MRRRALAAGPGRRPPPRIIATVIAAVALAVFATALAGLTASASLRADSPAEAAMADLFTSYAPNTGLIGNSWWQAAVALSTVETYAQTTGDTSYDTAIARAFALNSSRSFENGSDDDTAWWALAWLQAYDITQIPSYLAMAETDADYIHEDWDDACGGGVWWQRSPRAYKNAITNELFLELTAWLHNSIPGDAKYLRWARAEWSWFDHSGMINSSSLINDGLDGNCENNGDVTWTYNQGVILAGLAQLYQATGNRALLSAGERIARAAVGQLTVGGVLEEPCEGTGCAFRLDHNTQSFKGIFVSDLKVLAVTAGTPQFNAFLTAQAQSIEAHDTGRDNTLGMFWAGPVADVSSATQASALAALIASVRLPSAGPAARTTPGG
jgi:predicted alpha-1,6-mannanase (GH76 family)